MTKTCKARKLNGERCNATPTASGYCFTHSEAHKAKRDAARKLGGKHRRRVLGDTPFPDADPMTVKGLAAIMAATMRQCWTLENSISRHRVMAYLAATQRGIIESSEIESRLAAIENTLKLREVKE